MVRYEAVGHASSSRRMAWGPALRNVSKRGGCDLYQDEDESFPQTQKLFLGLLYQKCCLASLPKIISAITAKGFFGCLSLSAAQDQRHTPVVPAVSSFFLNGLLEIPLMRGWGTPLEPSSWFLAISLSSLVVFLLFYKYVTSDFFSSWVHFLFP